MCSLPTSPAVSVLMAVRDAAATISDALRSIERQTLDDFEAVVIDDGSVDASGEILDGFAAGDGRFRVVHLARAGVVASLNAGLALCRAPLVARMDADDISHPRRLELQREVLETRPEIGVVSCLVRHFPRRELRRGFRLYEDWLNAMVEHGQMARERFVESPVAHPSVMLRRALVEDAGGYRDGEWPEDYDLWLRLFARGIGFHKVPRHLLFWRDHGARLSRVDRRYGKAAFARCKAYHLVNGPLDGRPQLALWGAGETGRRIARDLMAEGAHIAVAVDIDPKRVGSTLFGVPIIAPEGLPAHLRPDSIVLVAVASRGARDVIRPQLDALGLREGESYYCVA